MTSQHKCSLYYSVSGDPFTVEERHTEPIEHTETILNIYTKEEEEVPNVTAIQQAERVTTELSLPYPIKKGQFFNSESVCMLINEAGALLRINGEHLFNISMLRDSGDFERLHVKFNQPAYEGRHEWHALQGNEHQIF